MRERSKCYWTDSCVEGCDLTCTDYTSFRGMLEDELFYKIILEENSKEYFDTVCEFDDGRYRI